MTEPTDAELRTWVQSLIADDDSVRTNDERDHMNFARAVLAKWGQPQAVAAGEPVGKCCYGGSTPKSACASCAAWAPPPQAVREPFTPAQQERMYRNRPNNVGKSASLAEWRRLEYIERAHDIAKGDQHG